MNSLETWYAGYTLIDITATGASSKSKNQHKQNQQRNWETIFQIINLRTQCTVIAYPTSPKSVHIKSHSFGSYYSGYHNCWKFIFSSETTNVFGSHSDPVEMLKHDFDNVPVIQGLNESAALIDPVFYTNSILKNIYFKVLNQTVGNLYI